MAGTALTPDLVDTLLDRLGTDDQFRAQFSADPKAALQSLGANADFDCGPCMFPKQLASKEQLQQSRQQYRSNLLGSTSHNIFNLEA